MRLRGAQRIGGDGEGKPFPGGLRGPACRISEALNLTYDDLKLDAEVPHFDLRRTKRGRQHLLPLSKFLRDEVWTDENIARLRSRGHEKMIRDVEVYPFPWTYKGASHH